jgi:hypothetical protein
MIGLLTCRDVSRIKINQSVANPERFEFEFQSEAENFHLTVYAATIQAAEALTAINAYLNDPLIRAGEILATVRRQIENLEAKFGITKEEKG